MRAARKKHGFTLAEMLIVVAIIGVLGGVAFIGVINYMRSMTKLEYDGYAKEIFVAAQNHLSMAASEGYLGRSDGIKEGEENDTYYFVVQNGDGVNDTDSLLELLLPFGSIDETVRSGSYIIRYQKSSARVLDVYFWSERAGRFSHSYTDSDYDGFLDATKEELKTYGGDKSVIGHYGGVDLQGSGTGSVTPLKAPSIEVKNAERLTVTVTNPNTSGVSVSLLITGSGEGRTIPLTSTSDPQTYVYVLDDITSAGHHFAEVFSDYGFYPGEDITVQASVGDGTNIVSSKKVTTNSLFASVSGTTAVISNIRHLENLDKTISGLSTSITNARQSVNLDWNDFASAIGGTVSIYKKDDSTGTKSGCFLPVTPGYTLDYNGNSKRISNITVDYSGAAGLFGSLSGGSVSNLELIDFSISGSGNAGALAGSMNGTTVSNVVAYHSAGNTGSTITGSGSAGGLIGSMSGGSVSGSAAALLVSSTSGDAGGLIGTASDNAAVTASYSGGHTSDGKYTSYNVTASGNAGGLIGDAGNAAITACYSTCSASGATVGGLVGRAGGSITNCYATGLVSGTTKGAFAGSLSGSESSYTSCRYYEVINQEVEKQGDVVTAINCLPAVSSGTYSGISPLDPDYGETPEDSAATYNQNAAKSGNAIPYDPMLRMYYADKYNLKTVADLGGSAGGFVTTHYGDWPAPELFTIKMT